MREQKAKFTSSLICDLFDCTTEGKMGRKQEIMDSDLVLGTMVSLCDV